MIKRILVASALAVMLPAGLSAQTVSVDQSGSYYYTTVRQYGDVTHMRTHQVGERRYDRINVRLADRMARIGERGWARQYARNCGGGGSGNDVRLEQDGRGNLAGAIQAGSNDSATIAQNGNANVSYTEQMGNNEIATTTQTGDHNIAFVMQRCR